MAHFVIEYKRSTGACHVTEFATSAAALQLRFKLEEERTDPDVEIASISADSLDVLKRTHSRYFMDEMFRTGIWGLIPPIIPKRGSPTVETATEPAP